MQRCHENLEAKLYIGGLPDDARVDEIKKVFQKIGKIRNVWVAHRPPGFAFVEFVNEQDALTAIIKLSGKKICGMDVTIQQSRGTFKGGKCCGGCKRVKRHRKDI